jgi:hypothetical protein
MLNCLWNCTCLDDDKQNRMPDNMALLLWQVWCNINYVSKQLWGKKLNGMNFANSIVKNGKNECLHHSVQSCIGWEILCPRSMIWHCQANIWAIYLPQLYIWLLDPNKVVSWIMQSDHAPVSPGIMMQTVKKPLQTSIKCEIQSQYSKQASRPSDIQKVLTPARPTFRHCHPPCSACKNRNLLKLLLDWK